MLIAPICPHWATHVWCSLFGHEVSPLRGPWPTVERAEDPALTKGWAFLKDTVKNLRAAVGKEKKDKIDGAIYVADTCVLNSSTPSTHTRTPEGRDGTVRRSRAPSRRRARWCLKFLPPRHHDRTTTGTRTGRSRRSTTSARRSGRKGCCPTRRRRSRRSRRRSSLRAARASRSSASRRT